MGKLLAATGLLASGLGALLGVNLWSGAHDYRVTAYFVSAERVVPGNDVVVGGVPVGRVDSVALAPEDGQAGALVTMKIDPRFAPLHRGTQATIRPKGLLGSMFIELRPAGGQAIPSGGSIPIQDTAAPVDLDQVNDIFDPATREKVKTLTREGGTSLDGRGQDVNALLQELPQISADTADLTAKLDQRDQQLDALQVEFDRVAYMMASEDASLRGDLSNGASLLDTTAAHQQQLQAELVHADSSLAKLNAALNGHQQDLNDLLKEMPALLDDLKAFQTNSATTLSVVNPCMSDILRTLAEMRSATAYRHPQGSGDANGYMLRVDTQLAGPESGTLNPPNATCGGG